MWRYFSLKNSLQFLRYLYACRNQVFFDFSKYLKYYKEFSKPQGFFQVLLSTIFYKKSGTFNASFLTWSSLACNIFSKKSWFLFSHKCQVQKNDDLITCFFCTIKNKNSKAARLMVGNPPSFPVWSCSKCFVCAFCLFTSFLSVLSVFTGIT